MTATSASAATSYRSYVLIVLIVVYVLNFVDRQIIGILAIPIQAELGLSDTAIGLMRGVSFAIFYSTLGVPIAWLADRANRAWIITASLALWSGMTALCGLAGSATQLFFSRMGVGIGEAGGVAPSYSIISDYFAPNARARAIAVYSFGIPIGGAIGNVFGGVIATVLDWRSAFIIVGLCGLVFAPVFLITVREPQRARFDPSAKSAPVSISHVLRTVAKKPSFWVLSLGGASSSIMGYGLFAWMPAFVVRSYGTILPGGMAFLPDWIIPQGAGALLYASYFYGFVVLIGGCAGLWFGGIAADWMGQRSRRAYALIPAVAFLGAAPLYLVGVLSPSLATLFLALLLPTALGMAWLGPVLTAFQHIVPSNMRTTSTAIFLLINNLLGLGLGDVLIGATSDLLQSQFGSESLRYSIAFGAVSYLLASALFFVASAYLERDWESAAPQLEDTLSTTTEVRA